MCGFSSAALPVDVVPIETLLPIVYRMAYYG